MVVIREGLFLIGKVSRACKVEQARQKSQKREEGKARNDFPDKVERSKSLAQVSDFSEVLLKWNHMIF